MLSFCAAAGALLLSKLWLRAAPGPAIRWATRGDDVPQGTERRWSADTMARAVAAAAAHWPFRATCLEQGIALVFLLTLFGIPARVTIGVARSGATLNGHACVQSSGRVVLGAAQMEGRVPLIGH